jgi:hypothetical protein
MSSSRVGGTDTLIPNRVKESQQGGKMVDVACFLSVPLQAIASPSISQVEMRERGLGSKCGTACSSPIGVDNSPIDRE